jgi:methylmalonyl-CoA mutase
LGDRTKFLKSTVTKVPALTSVRLAEDFEKFRRISEEYELMHAKKPTVFIANIGQLEDYTMRAAFITNLFSTGGVETQQSRGGTDLEKICTDFVNSTAKIIIICSTDDLYMTYAKVLVEKLKEHGPCVIYIAGKKNRGTKRLEDTEIESFISDGCNVLTILEKTFYESGITV